MLPVVCRAVIVFTLLVVGEATVLGSFVALVLGELMGEIARPLSEEEEKDD